MHLYFRSSSIHNSQDIETTVNVINRWMDKEDMVHMYNGILLSHRKEWNKAICSNMEGPRDYKWSRSNTIGYSFYVESKIWHRWTYLQNRLTDIDNRLEVAKGKEGGGGMHWEFGSSGWKVLYLEWIETSLVVSGWDSVLQMQGAQVQSLVGELGCTCHS